MKHINEDLDRMLALAKNATSDGTEFLFIAPEKLQAILLRIKELEAMLRDREKPEA